jgi:hypothetical protein
VNSHIFTLFEEAVLPHEGETDCGSMMGASEKKRKEKRRERTAYETFMA